MPRTITSPNPNAIIGYLPDGKPVYEIRGGAPEEGETQTESTETESTTEGQESTEETVEDPKDKEIKRLRGEAAGWRTQLREAQEQLKNAKTPEDIATAVAEVESKLAEKDKEIFARDRALVIATHKLPPELADLLPAEGKTVEELDALAKGLAKYVPSDTEEDEPDLKGGLNGGKPGKGSNAEVANQIRARRNRRF